jgi:hypothetical protein
MGELYFQPLPKIGDYTAAAELYDEELAEHGGAWVAAWKYNLRAQHNQNVFFQSKAVGTIALHIDSRDDDPVVARTETQAFKQGMLSGYGVIDLAHNSVVSFSDALNVLRVDLSEPKQDPGGMLLERPSLETRGRDGLELVGDDAQAIIERWGNDVCESERASQMYSLGCAAIIHAAYELHTGLNALKIAKFFDDYDWSAELDEILASNTGE